ncbi:serine/threonine protein kinase [Desulfosarcina sp. OttesenSCG-928-G10]|nr:serine/threonine protein kinase [Desulfosarcina sp. OttesenSCG-928-G10]
MAKKKKKAGSDRILRKTADSLDAIPAFSRLPESGEERFLLEKKLGAGGICEVYAALDLRRVEWGDANPKVAIKRLLPALADNAQAKLALAQEFCVLRHLAHPGVVRVFDLHKEPCGICFSMELLEGQTLQEALIEHPTGLEAAVGLGHGLFTVLHFLHCHGIVHGDIKPSNVFLASEKRIVLIDFNVATATAKTGAACSPVTRGLRESLHLPCFSLCYASPERLQDGKPSSADDVFAACCTVYEAVTGAHPFGRLTAAEAESRNSVPKKPAGLTAGQWRPVQKGLSFSSSKRPASGDLLYDFSRKPLLCSLREALRHFSS